MTRYNRKYKLQFGKTLKLADAFPYNPSLVGFKKNESLILTEHRISFSVGKSSGNSLNSTTIQIYNIAPDSYGFINSFRGQEISVKLEAGYEDDLVAIVIGTISNISDKYEGTDRITTVSVKEGYTNAKEAKTSASFPKDTSKSVIYDRLQKDLGLPNGVVIKPTGKITAPKTFEGKTVEQLKQFAKDNDSSFSIQNSSIHFIPLQTNDLVTVNKYTASTGLIGSPTALGDSSDVPQGNNTSPKVGIKFKVFLDGALAPNTLARIESKLYEGLYKIQKVEHFGDYRSSDWYTECEATQVSFFFEGDV